MKVKDIPFDELLGKLILFNNHPARITNAAYHRGEEIIKIKHISAKSVVRNDHRRKYFVFFNFKAYTPIIKKEIPSFFYVKEKVAILEYNYYLTAYLKEFQILEYNYFIFVSFNLNTMKRNMKCI